MHLRTTVPGIALGICLLAGCASAPGGPWVELKGKRIPVEIADTNEERARGLMFRDELAPSSGMLFIHDYEQPLAYWMKNTKISLDILYFDSSRRLVSAQLRVPPCSAGDSCPPYASAGSALYVLELNAGEADAMGMKAGDAIVFSPDITAAAIP